MSIIQTNYTAIHEWNDWRHLEDLISKKKTILKYYETLAILTIVFTREKKVENTVVCREKRWE
jgi:hypothetical protein